MADRIFGQALLEGDTVNPNFFFMLAKENKKELRSCVVQIPPTVLFEQGFAKAVFATESIRGQTGGEVKKKVGRDVDIDDVYEMMTKGTPERSLCAVLIYAPPKSNEMTAVRFLDKDGVKDYIYHEIEKPKSVLQRFILPKGNNNTLIHATWSPLLLLAEGRRCTHSLNDTHLDPNKRGITFEDPNSTSVNVVVSKTVIQSVTEMCQVVAQHFDKAERLSLTRMSAYFKVDANSKLHLLYSTSLRFESSAPQSNPISLDLGVKIGEETKKSVVKTGSGILRGHDPIQAMDMALRDADEKNKTMLITVPSIADNTTLMLKSLRGQKIKALSPSRVNDRAPSPKSPTDRSPTSPARAGGGFPVLDVQLPLSFAQQARGSHHQQPALSSSPAHSVASLLSSPAKSLVAANKSPPTSSGMAAAEELINPSGGDSKYFTLSKGAALPQPKQLMKVQHLLPNSPQNFKVALSTISEETIQIEWAKFLQLQNREIQKIRVRDAQRAAEQAKEAAHEANRRSDNVDSGTAPPVKIHSWFDYRQPDKKKDESMFAPDSPTIAPGTAGSEGRRSKSTQLTMLEVDPAVEQQEFMNYLREQLAKKAIEDKERVDKQQQQQHHQQDGDDLEEDPRFTYLPRDSKQRMAMPHDYSATKSTLLPPVFRNVGSGNNNSSNSTHKSLRGTRSPSPKGSKPSPQKVTSGVAKTPEPTSGAARSPSALSPPCAIGDGSSKAVVIACKSCPIPILRYAGGRNHQRSQCSGEPAELTLCHRNGN